MTTLTTRYGGLRPLLLPVLALLLLSGCTEQSSTSTQEAAMEQAPAAQDAEPAMPSPAAAPEPAPEPIAAAEPAAEPAASGQTGADGEKIYQGSCQSCHAAGIAGAPKLGDKEAWAPRIAKGKEALLASVTNGLNAMPPKGACMSCSEDDLRAAVAYMVEQGS